MAKTPTKPEAQSKTVEKPTKEVTTEQPPVAATPDMTTLLAEVRSLTDRLVIAEAKNTDQAATDGVDRVRPAGSVIVSSRMGNEQNQLSDPTWKGVRRPPKVDQVEATISRNGRLTKFPMTVQHN